MAYIILSDKELQINSITTIKSFSDTQFLIDINGIPYEIKGTELVLKEVTNDNSTIKILGEIYSIEKKSGLQAKNKKGFIKKLFS